MEAMKIFNYQETPVTFKNADGVVFVNPVDLSKPFGKHPKDWLRTKNHERYF
jgi:hypothetical protein